MKTPAFWYVVSDWRSFALALPAWLYGLVTAKRMALKPRFQSRIPVICVGNFTAGGAGKTPAAMAIAKILVKMGKTPVFLTRGFGGSLTGPIEVNRSRHKASEVGDEALLLVNIARTIVAQDRVAGARLAETLNADCIVMDDGLQNPHLFKDLRCVVVDGDAGWGNGYCVPAGPLRAPLAVQWRHTDLLIIVGEGAMVESLLMQAATEGVPVLGTKLVPDLEILNKANTWVAYAGLGMPEKFFRFLKLHGFTLASSQAFGDHHIYRDEDAQLLVSMSKKSDAQLVTTAKDAVKLTGSPALDALGKKSCVLRVELKVAGGDTLLENRLAKLFESANNTGPCH